METLEQYDASWLCEDGPYRRLVETMKAADPMLTTLDSTGAVAPARGKAQVVMMEFMENEGVCRQNFKRAEELREHLRIRPPSKLQGPRRRIYLLEGLAPDFVSVLGSHFRMTPSFFARHQRNLYGHMRTDYPSDRPPLPSTVDADRTFMLKYYELRFCQRDLAQLPTYYIACADTGRRVAFFRVGGETKAVGIVRRKCSYWRADDDHGGWDVVIICDPQLRRVTFLNSARTSNEASEWSGLKEPDGLDMPNVPFKGGYVDFVRQDDLGQVAEGLPRRGPQRQSTLDDLCFYYEQHASEFHSRPQRVAEITKKIAASQYMQLLDYLKALLGNTEWHISFEFNVSQKTRAAQLIDSQWLGSQWENQMTLGRRLHEYCDDIEEVLLNLGIHPPSSTPAQSKDPWSCEEDFRYINTRLLALKARANQLTASLGVLAGLHESRAALVEAKRSSQEGKRVKGLTLVGLIFIPFAYTCALFSMNEKYIPGAQHFWLYFAVSTPLLLAVFILMFIVQLTIDRKDA